MIIYKITNIVNGKIYVGCTTGTLERRWRRHVDRRKDRTLLARSILKYGAESFLIEQIDSAKSEKEMFEKEIFWIQELNSINRSIGYNMTPGGDRGPIKKGKDHPFFGVKSDRFSKLNKSRIGIKLTESHRANISLAQIGSRHSEDSLTKMSTSRKKVWDDPNSPYRKPGYREKISKARKGQPPTVVRPVTCNETNQTFSSITEAAKVLGIRSSSNITTHLKGEIKKVQGLTFKIAV